MRKSVSQANAKRMVTILTGDCRDLLETIPAESVALLRHVAAVLGTEGLRSSVPSWRRRFPG